jgi:uracil-DNA glycosylase family 4
VDETQRIAYLKAMGIDIWVPRTDGTRSMNSPAPSFEKEQRCGTQAARCESAKRSTNVLDRSHVLPDSQTPVPESRAPAEHAQSQSRPINDPSQLDWGALKQRVSGCTLCGLCNTRTQTVFGVGSRTADWLFIGEAPGADEDRQGEPFVGRAGQLLNNMLRAIGFSREQVYITNILKCRPPKNRDPKPEEAHTCEPYLKRQIDLLRPKIIIALGRTAAQNLLNTDTPIGRMRGKRYRYADTSIPVLVTYHPAYLLRSPGEKRKAWQDLLLAQKLVQLKFRKY